MVRFRNRTSSMLVQIKVNIDPEVLESAIRALLYEKSEVTSKSIKNRIRSEVEQKGISVINFPEIWGDDIFEADLDQQKVEDLVNKFFYLVK